ncbi:MAG: hypothetical protein JW936_06305 [Sedimentisphaerales bacterium]|nr:hypothetical protein [Sedimentisphaerales bacterium]
MQHMERNDKMHQQEHLNMERIAQRTIDEFNMLMSQARAKGMSIGQTVNLAASMGLLEADRETEGLAVEHENVALSG